VTGVRELLFDAAYEGASGSTSERRDAASEVARLLTAALSTPRPEAAIEATTSRVERLIGQRAAAKVLALASKSRRRTPRSRSWARNAQIKIAILTGKETRDLASALFDSLSAAGAQVWFYERSIKLGQRIRAADDSALEAADYVVLLVSRPALQSNFVGYELDVVHWLEMKERRERLLPVIADDLTFEELPPMLGPLEAASVARLGFDGVVAAIEERLATDRRKGAANGKEPRKR
jgi:hypothetical protein